LRAAGVTEAKLEALTTEGGIGLPQLRQNAICAALQRAEARRVVEFGCGEGKLLERLLGEPWVQAVVGVDARPQALHKAARRLERLPGGMQPDGRLRLLQGDATYADARLVGCDAAVLAEVVEHLTPDRLARAAAVVFGRLRPRTVVVSTPDRAYNAAWPELAPGALRHPDHRFEWTRAEFGAWAAAVAEGYGYRVALGAIGPAAPKAPGLDASRQSEACAPTQMAVFERMS
jgi:3' terminal RNA ribose 2'-O-methyltransferase Hen1